MPATKTKKFHGKLGPWRDIGNGWMARSDRDGNGQQAPAREAAAEMLERLVGAVAMNCGKEALEKVYGEEITADILEARAIIQVLHRR